MAQNEPTTSRQQHFNDCPNQSQVDSSFMNCQEAEFCGINQINNDYVASNTRSKERAMSSDTPTTTADHASQDTI